MTTIPVTLDDGATLPQRKTAGAAGFDLTATERVLLREGGTALIPTGVHIAIPDGRHADIRGRSSLATQGLEAHTGLIDPDYRGEIKVILHNLNGYIVTILPGMRIAQLVFPTIPYAELIQVDTLDDTERAGGGFGSTGVSA